MKFRILRYLLYILKKFIYKNSNKQSLSYVVDSVSNFCFKSWVAFNLNLRHLLYLPYYYTTTNLVLHIVPFIDLARIIYSIGTYDGTFAYEEMLGVLDNTITVNNNISPSTMLFAPSDSIPSSDQLPRNSKPASWNIGEPKLVPSQIVVSNDFKTLDGKDLTVINGKNGVLYVPDNTKGNEYVDMALTCFGLVFTIILLIYGNSGKDD